MGESGFLDNIMSAWGDEESLEGDVYPDETDSPNVNILLRAVRKYLDDKLGGQDLLQEINVTRERLESALDQHHVYCEATDFTPELEELATVTENGYRSFAAGLDLLEQGVETEDKGLIEKGVEQCKEATRLLEESNRKFMRLHRDYQRVECVMCGHLNEAGRKECEKCSAVLPEAMRQAAAQSQENAQDMVMVPEEYLHLYEACDNVAAGEIPLSEWQKHVDKFKSGFSSAADGVKDQLQMHKEQLSEVPGLIEDAESLVEALEEALAALSEMELFSSDGDPEHLNQGWMDLLSATQKIQHRGMYFYKALQEFVESEQLPAEADA